MKHNKFYLGCKCPNKTWNKYKKTPFCPTCGEKIIEKSSLAYVHVYFDGDDNESEFFTLSELKKMLEDEEDEEGRR